MYAPSGVFAPDVNFAPVRNYFPGARGATIATIGSAASPDGTVYASNPTAMPSENAAPVNDTTVGGKPLAWWTGILLLVGLIFYFGRKAGEADEFKNIRASTYNITLVGLMSVLFLTFAKIIAVKMQKVPGLSGLASLLIAA